MAIEVGFVGAGGRAKSHMRVLHEMADVEIVAICDVVQETAEAASQEFGAKSYTEHAAMIEKETLQAVYVSVPTFAHTDAEILAVQKGAHLFVEKPVADTMDKALEIQEAVQQAGVISCVGYQVRYSGYVQQAKAFLEDQTVAMVDVKRWGGLPSTPWWRVMAQSGGQIVEQTTHQVDLMRYLIGEVDEVHAYCAHRTFGDEEGVDVPDVYAINFHFENGAIGGLTSACSFREGGGSGSFSIALKNKRAEVESDGIAIYPEGAADPGPMPESSDIDAVFMNAIRTGDTSGILSDYADGVRTLDITLAANLSAAEGKPIRTYFAS